MLTILLELVLVSMLTKCWTISMLLVPIISSSKNSLLACFWVYFFFNIVFGKWAAIKEKLHLSHPFFLFPAVAHSFVSSSLFQMSPLLLIHTVGFWVINPFQLYKDICFLLFLQFSLLFSVSICLSVFLRDTFILLFSSPSTSVWIFTSTFSISLCKLFLVR